MAKLKIIMDGEELIITCRSYRQNSDSDSIIVECLNSEGLLIFIGIAKKYVYIKWVD